MPFQLRQGTRDWFRHIKGDFDVKFDMYYFCLIAGLLEGEKRKVSSDKTSELVSNFPGPYREKGRYIIALFLSRELRSLGVNFSDRETLHSQISRLIDSRATSRLSSEGMRRMNEYSYGGLDVIKEWFEEEPQSLEEFLPRYYRYLKDAEPENKLQHEQTDSRIEESRVSIASLDDDTWVDT